MLEHTVEVFADCYDHGNAFGFGFVRDDGTRHGLKMTPATAERLYERFTEAIERMRNQQEKWAGV